MRFKDFNRRSLLAALLLGAAATFGTAISPARAQSDYPSRQIHLVVGFAAGGGNDIFARVVAEKASQILGQTVFVDNKPGAGGPAVRRIRLERDARRLHHSGRRLWRDRDRGGDLRRPEISSDQDAHPARHDRELPAVHGDGRGQSVEEPQRVRRMDQAASRQGELRQLFAGLHHHRSNCSSSSAAWPAP